MPAAIRKITAAKPYAHSAPNACRKPAPISGPGIRRMLSVLQSRPTARPTWLGRTTSAIIARRVGNSIDQTIPAKKMKTSRCQNAISVSATSAARPMYITQSTKSAAIHSRRRSIRSAIAPTKKPNSSRGAIRIRKAIATAPTSPVSS